MKVCLESENIDKLSHRGIMAYVAVTLAGSAAVTTAVLAGLVKVSTGTMLEGLKELAVALPEAVAKDKGKWRCGDRTAALVVQNVDSPPSVRAGFVDVLKAYWDYMNPGAKFIYTGKDGRAVQQFIRDHPSWDVDQWAQALRNRARSVVNPSEVFFAWIPRLQDYLAGPLDEYGKPRGETGKHGQAISVEAANRAAREAARANRAGA